MLGMEYTQIEFEQKPTFSLCGETEFSRVRSLMKINLCSIMEEGTCSWAESHTLGYFSVVCFYSISFCSINVFILQVRGKYIHTCIYINIDI